MYIMISFEGRYRYMNTKNLSTQKMNKYSVDFVATGVVASSALTTTNRSKRCLLI